MLLYGEPSSASWVCPPRGGIDIIGNPVLFRQGKWFEESSLLAVIVLNQPFAEDLRGFWFDQVRVKRWPWGLTGRGRKRPMLAGTACNIRSRAVRLREMIINKISALPNSAS